MATQPSAYISAYVIVKEGSFFKNGVQVHHAQTDELFLNNAYTALALNYPKFYKMDALGKLGILTTDVLLKDIPYQDYQPFETGIVLSNHNASIEADVNYFNSVSEIPSPALFVYTLPNIVVGEISIRYRFKGENAFFVQENFEAEWLQFYVSDLLENQNLSACLAGWINVADGKYDAFIFYVEKIKRDGSLIFEAGNLEQLYRN